MNYKNDNLILLFEFINLLLLLIKIIQNKYDLTHHSNQFNQI